MCIEQGRNIIRTVLTELLKSLTAGSCYQLQHMPIFHEVYTLMAEKSIWGLREWDILVLCKEGKSRWEFTVRNTHIHMHILYESVKHEPTKHKWQAVKPCLLWSGCLNHYLLLVHFFPFSPFKDEEATTRLGCLTALLKGPMSHWTINCNLMSI